MARLEIRRATSVRFLCEQFMNRIFLFLLMVVAAVLSGQFENRAIGQMDSVFYTPPYVRAGEFSLREVQPYQMSSSFESKFVPLSSKEAGNFFSIYNTFVIGRSFDASVKFKFSIEC